VSRLVELWVRVGAAERWIPELLAIHAELLARAATVPLEARDPVLLTALLTVHAAAVLRRLRASNAEIERAAMLARGPAEPAGSTAADVRRWLSAVGRGADDLLELYALREGREAPWSATVRGVRERGEALARGDLAVSGTDLHALGAAGPRLGELLAALLDRVLEDPALNQRDRLLVLARELM
jgi:tRNA nucleotidyltransferase (CCA-adding enzyme)